MEVKKIFKVSRKTFLNPSGWIDYDSLKAQNKTIWQILKTTFTADRPLREETFEEATQRQGLTEADIREAETSYKTYAYLFAILGVAAIVFAFYLIFVHYTLAGWVLGMVVAALLFGQAFRYDFWAFQIKHKKLGCTFAEWKRGKIDEEKS